MISLSLVNFKFTFHMLKTPLLHKLWKLEISCVLCADDSLSSTYKTNSGWVSNKLWMSSQSLHIMVQMRLGLEIQWNKVDSG